MTTSQSGYWKRALRTLPVLAGALLALGCSGKADPGGSPSAQEPVAQSEQALIDQDLDLGGFEPHLAVDPSNTQNVAVAQFTSVSLSTDGGATFPVTVNAVIPAGFNLSFGGDPVLVYDRQGNLFLAFLARNNVTTTLDVFIQPIDHAAGTAIGTAVNVSASAGMPSASGFFADKEWLAIDTFAGSPFLDRMYMVWTDFSGANVTVLASFSSDGGLNWSAAQTLTVPAEGFPWPPHVAVAPNGDVYAAYHASANSEIILVRSPFDSAVGSGGVFDLATKFSVFAPGNANLTFNVQGSPPTLDRNRSWTQGSHQPYILPDPTNANRVLVIASDDPTDANNGPGFDDAAVFSVTTTDRGANWTAPVQVDSGPGASHQLFPVGAFDQDSQCVSVAYYDSRAGATNPAGNFLLDVFVRTSADSGATWGPEIQINDTPFDPDLNAQDRFPPTQTFRIGEYFGLAQARGIAWTGNDPAAPPGTGAQEIIFDFSDGIAPTFTSVPADVTTTDCTAPNIGTATAEDDTCGIGGVVVTSDAPAQFPLGTTVVTWIATDAAGNSTTATQRVTVDLGDDASCCPAGTNVIVGTPSNNNIVGTNGPDCILGLGAQDTINGLGGNDFISGGEGNDTINGGTGNDTIFGGAGQDPIDGGSGDDSLSGGGGDDTVLGGIGNDTLRGGQGQDSLQGQAGDDDLFGDDGDDNLQGGDGNDDLVGGVNNDVCNGGAGTNTFAQCEFGAPDSCTDDLTNGTETDLDCGGACPRCDDGEGCATGNDCQSGVCSAGICQDTPAGSLVTTALTTTTDWGAGYCVTLNVTNNAAVLATSFTVALDTGASTIYTSWNGTFSGTTGSITVAPAFSWNATLDPGETDTSMGFCANRTVPGSGVLPTVLNTTATF